MKTQRNGIKFLIFKVYRIFENSLRSFFFSSSNIKGILKMLLKRSIIKKEKESGEEKILEKQNK